MDTYIILRKEADQGQAVHQFSTKVAGLTRGVSATPQLHVEQLPVHEFLDLKRDPAVVAASRSMPTKLIEPFSGSQSNDQDAWGIAAVNADKSTFTGAGVTVAVLDTGIDRDHPAFKGVKLQQKDFTGEGDKDVNGHGTHCAGTIFGRDVNGVRIGIARGVEQALIGKVIAKNGGSSEWLFQGMQWALASGANVISMSLGFDFPGLVKMRNEAGLPIELATSDALEAYRGNLRMLDAIMNLFKAHAAFGDTPVVIAAAGNESRRDERSDFKIAASLPAAADGILSVAAAGRQREKYKIASFSNTQAKVSAPGVDVISAWPGGNLKSLNGTSMACPHVAGVAALWWEHAVKNNAPTPSALTLSKLFAHASHEHFVDGLNNTDYGLGIVTSPLGNDK